MSDKENEGSCRINTGDGKVFDDYDSVFDEAMMRELSDSDMMASASFPPPPAEFDNVASGALVSSNSKDPDHVHFSKDGRETSKNKGKGKGEKKDRNRLKRSYTNQGLGSPSISIRGEKKKRLRREGRRFVNARRFFEDQARDSGGESDALDSEEDGRSDLNFYEDDGFVVPDRETSDHGGNEGGAKSDVSCQSGGKPIEEEEGGNDDIHPSALLFNQRYADYCRHGSGYEEKRLQSVATGGQERDGHWFQRLQTRFKDMHEPTPKELLLLHVDFHEHLNRPYTEQGGLLEIDDTPVCLHILGDSNDRLERRFTRSSELYAFNTQLYESFKQVTGREMKLYVKENLKLLKYSEMIYQSCTRMISEARSIAERRCITTQNRMHHITSQSLIENFRTAIMTGGDEFLTHDTIGRYMRTSGDFAFSCMDEYRDSVTDSDLEISRRLHWRMIRDGLRHDGEHVYHREGNGQMVKGMTLRQYLIETKHSNLVPGLNFMKMRISTMIDEMKTPIEALAMNWDTEIICLPHKDGRLVYFNLYTCLAFENEDVDPMRRENISPRYIHTDVEKVSRLLQLYHVSSNTDLYDPWSMEIYADLVRPGDVNHFSSILHYQLVEDPEDPLPGPHDPVDGRRYVDEEWVYEEYRHPCPGLARHYVRNPAAVFKERLGFDAQLQRHRVANPVKASDKHGPDEHWNLLVGEAKTGKSHAQMYYREHLPEFKGRDGSRTCVIFKNKSGSSGEQFNGHDVGSCTLVLQIDEITADSDLNREFLNIVTGFGGAERRQAKGENCTNSEAWCHLIITGNQGPSFCLQHSLPSTDRRLLPAYTFWMHLKYGQAAAEKSQEQGCVSGDYKTHGMAMTMAAQQHSQFARWMISLAPGVYADDYTTGMVDKQQQMMVIMLRNVIQNMIAEGHLVRSPGSLIPVTKVLIPYVETYAREVKRQTKFTFGRHMIESLQRLVYGNLVYIEGNTEMKTRDALKAHGVSICDGVRHNLFGYEATRLRGIQFPPLNNCLVKDPCEYYNVGFAKRNQQATGQQPFRQKDTDRGSGGGEEREVGSFFSWYTVKPPEDPSVVFFCGDESNANFEDYYFSGIGLNPRAFKPLSGAGYKGDRSGEKAVKTFQRVMGEKKGVCHVSKSTGSLECDPDELCRYFSPLEAKNLERCMEVINRSSYGVSRQAKRKKYLNLQARVPPRFRQRRYCGVHPKLLVDSKLKEFVQYELNKKDGRYHRVDRNIPLPENGYLSPNEGNILFNTVLADLIEFDADAPLGLKWRTGRRAAGFLRGKLEIVHRFLCRIYSLLLYRREMCRKAGVTEYIHRLDFNYKTVSNLLRFVEVRLVSEKRSNFGAFYEAACKTYRMTT